MTAAAAKTATRSFYANVSKAGGRLCEWGSWKSTSVSYVVAEHANAALITSKEAERCAGDATQECWGPSLLLAPTTFRGLRMKEQLTRRFLSDFRVQNK